MRKTSDGYTDATIGNLIRSIFEPWFIPSECGFLGSGVPRLVRRGPHHQRGGKTELDWNRLVEGCLEGDQPSWTALVLRTQGTIEMTVGRTCRRHGLSVDDIVQESYLSAFQKLQQLRNPSATPQWLCSLARNLARRAARPEPIQLELDESTTADDRRNESCRIGFRLRLRTALAELNERQRIAIIQHYYRGADYQQISSALGISIESV